MSGKKIWWDGNSTTCVEHAGATLTAYIEAHPRRKTHITRFGEAYLMDAEEISAIQKIIGHSEVCESCQYEQGLRIGA